LPSLFALMIVGCVVACGEDPDVGDDPQPGSSGSAHGGGGGSDELVPFCAALQVVRDKCQRCHTDPPQNGAPAALLTYEDFQRPYGASGERKYWEAASEAVERDIMPYVALNEPPTSLMPPVEPLTSDEKATLLGWLEQGAKPEGGTDCP
jgi:hypothetical protein